MAPEERGETPCITIRAQRNWRGSGRICSATSVRSSRKGRGLVLQRGLELAAMSRNLTGAAGERLAERFGDLVLWGACSPDDWPIGAVITMLRTSADLSPSERVLHADLLRPLLRLTRSADDLHGLRAGRCRPPG